MYVVKYLGPEPFRVYSPFLQQKVAFTSDITFIHSTSFQEKLIFLDVSALTSKAI